MSKINPIWVILVLIFTTSVNSILAQQNGLTLSLEKLLKEAIDKNPEIKSAESRWRASEEKPIQVSTLPDPMFSYSRYGESVETRVGPQESVLILSQKIPFPGKLGLKGKMAEQDAVAENQNYDATIRDVVFEVKKTYYDLYWIDQSIVTLNQYLDILQDFTTVAEQKYATGQGIQASVLQSQVELSSTLERRFGFEKMRENAAARLNALLDRSQESEVATAATIDTFRTRFDEAVLADVALAQREELQAVQAMVEKSEFSKSLAKKEYLPDFDIRANYFDISKGVSIAPDAGKNAWSLMVGLNLPIWLGKRNAAVREAEQIISSNKLNYENWENQVRAEIRDLYLQLEISGKTLDLYEQGLITQAESSLESAMASYRTGRLDFLSLLDAERMLLHLHLGHIKERSHYQKELASLERAVGGQLPN